MSEIHEKIKILLANKKMSQTTLAGLMNVTPDAVSSWVRGINHVSVADLIRLCGFLDIPIQDMVNNDYNIQEYSEIEKGRCLPEFVQNIPKIYQDTVHTVFDVGLANGGMLHRFKNCAGAECSAIYCSGEEVWWHYRDQEAKMIRDWNEVYAND